MKAKLAVVTAGTWLILLILAIINAITRESLYKPFLGDLLAHQLSSVIFILLVLFLTYAVLRIGKLELHNTEAFLMGTTWLVATIVFEFIAGHYVFGNPWEKLFADYNLLEGRIWALVLLNIFIAPYIANKILRSRKIK
ncbi:MAG: hypothetical protein QXJ58_05615 [Archaeoglobaceae archaeon]